MPSLADTTIRHTLPSSSMCIPFLKLFVSTVPATADDGSYETVTSSFVTRTGFSIPPAVTITSSSIRIPKRPAR